jgi:hygromycin-B 7''-O-kinase
MAPGRPPTVPIDEATARAIAARHGVAADRAEPLPSIGVINTVLALGPDVVLRVPRDHPGHVEQLRREAVAIPAATVAGVRTPRLVAHDDACDLLPVPYLLVERVPGVDVETSGRDVAALGPCWRAVGAELARLHTMAPPVLADVPLEADETGDPNVLVDARAADGWISTMEAARLHRWFARLDQATPPPSQVLVHGDLQIANVLVDPATGALAALVDWGCARLTDPCIDLRVVPMAALDPLLTGYGEAGGDPSVTAAGVLRRKLQLDLWALAFGPQPGTAWGERAVARLVDLMVHLASPSGARWRALVDG